MADFLFIARVEINPDADDFAGYSARRFFSLIRQLPGYEGSVQRRFIREAEQRKKAQTKRLAGMKTPSGAWDWLSLAAKAKKRGGKGMEYGHKE